MAQLTREQILRYSRHLIMPEVGIDGQQKLKDAGILLIGAGGLGSPLGLYLAAAGVGRLGIVDFDKVDFTNLQRQIMHNLHSIGKSKVESGKQFLQQVNPTIKVNAVEAKATKALLDELLPTVDLVLDCTDNFFTRHLINTSCIKHKIPLISGSVLRFNGQISVFDLRDPTLPCYACIFSPDESFEEVSCASMGIFAPLVGIIGTMQAAQALQILIGLGEPLVGRMLLWNARNTQIDEIRITRNPECSVCGK